MKHKDDLLNIQDDSEDLFFCRFVIIAQMSVEKSDSIQIFDISSETVSISADLTASASAIRGKATDSYTSVPWHVIILFSSLNPNNTCFH